MGGDFSKMWARRRGEPHHSLVLEESFGYAIDHLDRRIGTEQRSDDGGEAIFLARYDGAAAELCGALVYERAVDGRLVRALTCFPEYEHPSPSPRSRALIWVMVAASSALCSWAAGVVGLVVGLPLSLAIVVSLGGGAQSIGLRWSRVEGTPEPWEAKVLGAPAVLGQEPDEHCDTDAIAEAVIDSIQERDAVG